jgi:hypothetical protein
VLVTHHFLAGWLVRAAQDAPPWRWLTLTHAHAGLTVIQYRSTFTFRNRQTRSVAAAKMSLARTDQPVTMTG